MSNASWAHDNTEGWVVRSTQSVTGDMVTVIAKSGRTKTVRLGRKLRPNIFAIGPAENIESGEEYGAPYLMVDGEKFPLRGPSQQIWQGDTKSTKFRIVFCSSVIHDRVQIMVWSFEHNNWILNHPFFGPNHSHTFDEAVEIIRRIHEKW